MMSAQSPPQPTRAWQLTVEHRKKQGEEERIRQDKEKAEEDERKEKLKVSRLLRYCNAFAEINRTTLSNFAPSYE